MQMWVSSVPVQKWLRRAQCRCRCGSSEPSAGADVGELSPGADVGEPSAGADVGEPSAGADVGELSPGADVARLGTWFSELTDGSVTSALQPDRRPWRLLRARL